MVWAFMLGTYFVGYFLTFVSFKDLFFPFNEWSLSGPSAFQAKRIIIFSLNLTKKARIILNSYSFLHSPAVEESTFLHSPNPVLYMTTDHCLKPQIQLLAAGKFSVPDLMAMCRDFPLSSVTLIIAMLLLNCSNHTTNLLSDSQNSSCSGPFFVQRTCHIVHNTVHCFYSVQHWWHNS
jgi:hypothetical protein